MDETTPAPVSSPEPKPVETGSAPLAADGTGLAPNIAATICAAVPLVGGVIFLVLEKKNAFVRFWAMQSVFFGGAVIGFSIASRIASFVMGQIPILGKLVIFLLWIIGMLVGIASLVVWVISIVQALSNKEWEIPVLGKLTRKQLAGATIV